MKRIKIISVVLMLCLVCAPLLASCGGGGENVQEVPQDLKYSGETITFLTNSVNSTYESEIKENTYDGDNAPSEQTLPNAMNSALREREEILIDTLGVTIKEVKEHCPTRPGDFVNVVTQLRASGSTDYDVVVPCLYDASALALSDLLVDLNSIDALQLDQPWWNQEFNRVMTYYNKLYFTIGEVGHGSKSSSASLYFNLKFWNQYNLSDQFGGDPYKLVRDGKWTLDTLLETVLAVPVKDLNNDGKITYKDEFAWSGQNDDLWSLFFAAGQKIASPGANGAPVLTMKTEASIKVVEKMQTLVRDKDHYVSANDYFGEAEWPAELTRQSFTDGRCLYFNADIGSLITIGSNMDAETPFGILPLPKADKNQESYYSLINPWTTTCFAIPSMITGDRLTFIAECLDCLGEASMTTTKTAYDDILGYMKIRDDDSLDMLNNYILPNRSCDIGLVSQWGGLDALLQQLRTAGVNFVSAYSAKESSAKVAMQKFSEFYSK